jgi:hypothetical protein
MVFMIGATLWAYPYRDYDSNYTYYDGPYYGAQYLDYGAQYLGALPGAYGEARNANLAADPRLSDRVKRAAVAKRSASVAPHVAKLASGPSTTGAATTAVPRNHTHQTSRQ